MHARRAAGNIQQLGPALDYASEAIRIAPPYEAPALFKRSAQVWLAYWSRAEKSEGSLAWGAERARFATYLRTTLGSLDSVAAAEAARPASAQ
ncbi:MAG TPA: hypothetical protein VE891_03670 [Allosphingosinicella sp.]|nr:hypothetical protein [Allosphingosinicella sp.]